ncbi:MAG: GNAT family N-acetyltransferase [Halanaerobiales bacterium]
MQLIFWDERIKVRRLKDSSEDYSLFVTWLSDLDVCEYYEGRTKPFSYEMVLEKFQERAKGNDIVTVGIIEYESKAIGFVQFYPTKPGEYHESDVIDRTKFKISYGMDIVIGDKNYWNKGIGSHTIKLMSKYLFSEKKADILLIAPQAWNKRAIYCYEKSGFRRLKIIKNMELHDNEYKDGILMAKTKYGLEAKTILL